MKILVTGGAGAIGSNLIERLIKEGHDVSGLDALTPYYDPNIKKSTGEYLESLGAKMYYKDILDEGIDSLFSDVEVVYHLAAQPGISNTTPFLDYVRNNILATHRLLEVVKNIKSLKLFVNASTSSVYGALANGAEDTNPAPTSNYGVTKLAAEQLALSYHRSVGLPVVNIRFFSVLGERERPEKFFFKLIKSLHEDSEITMYEGSENHVRSYTYVGDIVEGCVSLLDKVDSVVGETFNLGNDKTSTTGDALKMVEEIMGKKAKIKILPKRHGDQIETSAKIDKARKVIGYSPRVDLKMALAKEVEWYKKFVHGKF